MTVLSRPWLCAHALRLLSRPQPKIHQAGESQNAQSETQVKTPFKTISVDGIRVIREKDNANRVKDTVKNRAERLLSGPWVSLGGKGFLPGHGT